MADSTYTVKGYLPWYRYGVCRIQQPRWMRKLMIGDVVSNGGPWRIVRNLSRRNDGRLMYATFVIRHCSWTHRCYTVMTATDLRLQGYRRVRVKARQLRKRIDLKIDAAIHQPLKEPKILTCCDVEGTP